MKISLTAWKIVGYTNNNHYHILGVYMDLANPLDPVKSTQSNLKKWVGLGKWVDMDFKIEKPIKKWVLDKTGPNPKNPPTH
jgi:hypothetical protein